jgi:hypothetical protein
MDFLIILPESRKDRRPRGVLSGILRELTSQVSPEERPPPCMMRRPVPDGLQRADAE